MSHMAADGVHKELLNLGFGHVQLSHQVQEDPTGDGRSKLGDLPRAKRWDQSPADKPDRPDRSVRSLWGVG